MEITVIAQKIETKRVNKSIYSTVSFLKTINFNKIELFYHIKRKYADHILLKIN